MSDASDSSFRDAARRALRRLSVASHLPEPPRIERVVMDVNVEGRSEMVAFGFKDGLLTWIVSNGEQEGVHALAALRVLAGDAGSERAAEDAPPMTSEWIELGARASVPSTVRTIPTHATAAKHHEALASALEEIVIAVCRVGALQADAAPSVKEALSRLVSKAPEPVPLGVARWVGRLRDAMRRKDVSALVTVLAGACRLVSDLRSDTPDRRLVVSFLGPDANVTSHVERAYDRSFVEVGREWVSGLERSAIERRYLLDLQSAELVCEHRLRGEGDGSVGPFPRIVHAGMVELEQGAEPRRARLVQYVVSARVEHETWEKVRASSHRRFSGLVEGYRVAITRYPGVAEPFVLVVPTRMAEEPDLVLYDAEDARLPLHASDDPALLNVIRKLRESHEIDWVAGRLVDREGALLLRPCSVAAREDGLTRVFRLR